MPAMHLIKLLFSQVGSTKSRDKSTLEAFSLASGILFSLQRKNREKRGQSEYANNISTRFLPRLVHHFPPDFVVILIWKFVDALRCFFSEHNFETAPNFHMHMTEREWEGDSIGMYVISMVCAPVACPAAPIHVWQGISYAWNHFMCNLVQIYNVISFTFRFFF